MRQLLQLVVFPDGLRTHRRGLSLGLDSRLLGRHWYPYSLAHALVSVISHTDPPAGHYRMNYSYAGEVGDWDLSSADYSGSKTVRVSHVLCAMFGVALSCLGQQSCRWMARIRWSRALLFYWKEVIAPGLSGNRDACPGGASMRCRCAVRLCAGLCRALEQLHSRIPPVRSQRPEPSHALQPCLCRFERCSACRAPAHREL